MSWSIAAGGILLIAAAALAGLWYGRRTGDTQGRISRRIRWSTALCTGCGIGLILLGVFTGQKGEAGSEKNAAQSTGPVVPVRVSPLRLSTIKETITAYGTVVAQPGGTRIVSVPFESRVVRLFVTAGEQVQPGTPLAEIEASAGSQLQLKQAVGREAAARMELQQVQEEFNQRLATNSQLEAAQQTFRAAQRTLDTLQRQGVGRATQLTAQFAGIIGSVAVRQGQIVAAGAPLVENALENRIEVELGIEPEDIPYIHDDAAVELSSVHTDTAPSTGHVRLITRKVNPATRLVDVFVALPPGSALMLEAYVRADIVTASKRTLVVPREAVLPEKNDYALFTVENGIAVKHNVQVGLQSSTEVEVVGTGLEEGMSVVLAGNYELTPGMAVSRETTR